MFCCLFYCRIQFITWGKKNQLRANSRTIWLAGVCVYSWSAWLISRCTALRPARSNEQFTGSLARKKHFPCCLYCELTQKLQSCKLCKLAMYVMQSCSVLLVFFFFFLAFFPAVARFSLGVGCSGRMLGFCVLREGQIMAKRPFQKAGWSSSIAQQFRSKCMNMICGCSGTCQSNAKCCSVLVGLFVTPFSKHKQIDSLAPAAAYDIYTTCMIQHASLGKQACVLSILVLF